MFKPCREWKIAFISVAFSCRALILVWDLSQGSILVFFLIIECGFFSSSKNSGEKKSFVPIFFT